MTNILYSTDVNGYELLIVSIYSLLKSKNIDSTYSITIAYKKLDNYHLANIKKIINSFQNVQINFIDCKPYDKSYGLSNIFKKEDNVLNIAWPSPMYYFFLVKYFYKENIKKVLYIDIDTIIQHDLTNLYNFHFETTIAGTKCNVIIPYIQMQNMGCDTKGITFKSFFDKNPHKYDDYINSGVVLINLEKFRLFDLEQIFKLAHEKHFNDQDLLSYYFNGDITNFELKYNFCVHFFIDEIYEYQIKLNNTSLNDINNFRQVMDIIHLSTRPKPTHFFSYQTFKIIKKINGVDNFIDLLSIPQQIMEHFKTILNVSEQQLIMNLHNDWKQYIYARTQKLRLYEKVFWEWGKLWFECSNKFNLY